MPAWIIEDFEIPEILRYWTRRLPWPVDALPQCRGWLSTSPVRRYHQPHKWMRYLSLSTPLHELHARNFVLVTCRIGSYTSAADSRPRTSHASYCIYMHDDLLSRVIELAILCIIHLHQFLTTDGMMVLLTLLTVLEPRLTHQRLKHHIHIVLPFSLNRIPVIYHGQLP